MPAGTPRDRRASSRSGAALRGMCSGGGVLSCGGRLDATHLLGSMPAGEPETGGHRRVTSIVLRDDDSSPLRCLASVASAGSHTLARPGGSAQGVARSGPAPLAGAPFGHPKVPSCRAGRTQGPWSWRPGGRRHALALLGEALEADGLVTFDGLYVGVLPSRSPLPVEGRRPVAPAPAATPLRVWPYLPSVGTMIGTVRRSGWLEPGGPHRKPEARLRLSAGVHVPRCPTSMLAFTPSRPRALFPGPHCRRTVDLTRCSTAGDTCPRPRYSDSRDPISPRGSTG